MEPRVVELRQGILEKNDALAQLLRTRFSAAGVLCVNVISSPGTGKTALLERVLAALVEQGLRPVALVGDCATERDAERLARSGAPVRQIVTDGICHLEADMVEHHLEGWDLDDVDVLVVENVGNLVCPTGFDLGESVRVVALSVTEGEDKPLKYPQVFASADLVVITKIDLAEACEFDRDFAIDAIRDVAPATPVVETSARAGTGIDDLVDALLRHRPDVAALAAEAARTRQPI